MTPPQLLTEALELLTKRTESLYFDIEQLDPEPTMEHIQTYLLLSDNNMLPNFRLTDADGHRNWYLQPQLAYVLPAIITERTHRIVLLRDEQLPKEPLRLDSMAVTTAHELALAIIDYCTTVAAYHFSQDHRLHRPDEDSAQLLAEVAQIVVPGQVFTRRLASFEIDSLISPDNNVHIAQEYTQTLHRPDDSTHNLYMLAFTRTPESDPGAEVDHLPWQLAIQRSTHEDGAIEHDELELTEYAADADEDREDYSVFNDLSRHVFNDVLLHGTIDQSVARLIDVPPMAPEPHQDRILVHFGDPNSTAPDELKATDPTAR